MKKRLACLEEKEIDHALGQGFSHSQNSHLDEEHSLLPQVFLSGITAMEALYKDSH